jgi:hypothetical protein
MQNDAWKQYAADFNSLSDAEIESESEQCRNQVDEAESWLEAVASWEAAGKPRTPPHAKDAADV